MKVAVSRIDRDFGEADREAAKQYVLRERMNNPKLQTAEIITFGTNKLKRNVEDVCRSLGLGQDVMKEIKKQIITVDGKDVVDSRTREKYPQVFKYTDVLEGIVTTTGVHAAGVLVSDYNLAAYVGLCSTKNSPYLASALDMKELDALNFVKWDYLGLTNIDLKNKVERMVGIDRLTPDNVDLEDADVWREITKDTTLIFQWESNSAQAYLRKFMSEETLEKARARTKDFSMLKWLSFGNGLLRPGCASYRDDVANGEFYDNGFDALNDFLAKEAGHLCMQETIMGFLVTFCGYSKAESDNVRRAIAKKKGTETLLPEIERRFVDTVTREYGLSHERAQEVIKPFIVTILDASNYSFSWNHSDPYSFIGYSLGYLRHYYPVEFLTCALDIFGDDQEKTANIISFANSKGIKIMPARYGRSGANYTPDKENNAIYKGMSSIKFMNKTVPEELLALSNAVDVKGSFMKLLQALQETSLDARQLEILIGLDFFAAFGNAPTLSHIAQLFEFLKKGAAKSISKEKVDGSPVGELVKKYSTGLTKTGKEAKSYTITDMEGLLGACESWAYSLAHPDTDYKSKIQFQLEYLGYADMVSGKEEDRQKLIILDMFPLKGKQSGEVWAYALTTRSVGSGKVARITVRKWKFDARPFGKLDMIYCHSCPKDKKGYFNLEAYDVL